MSCHLGGSSWEQIKIVAKTAKSGRSKKVDHAIGDTNNVMLVNVIIAGISFGYSDCERFFRIHHDVIYFSNIILKIQTVFAILS